MHHILLIVLAFFLFWLAAKTEGKGISGLFGLGGIALFCAGVGLPF